MAGQEAPWGGRASAADRVILGLFVGVPFLAVPAGGALVWGRGIGWHDIALSAVMYLITGHGITVGYHRLFTHRAFRCSRVLRVALAVAGTMAIEGDVVTWAADHRRHHQYSDRDGDPHSPWRYGTSAWAVAKGLAWAHVGWIFRNDTTNQRKFVPDLLSDPDVMRVVRQQPLWALVSFGGPALAGGLWSMSWHDALTAFFWAGLVRVGLVHHVTWSVNSICHTTGDRPFRSRDKSGNVWWLALLSGGESWHNGHHADPACARHGVLRGQVDSSARLIRVFELAGWAHDVRWPSRRSSPSRVAAR
jgi:stearoyl-CoA desaturase (delta-9 desaturase)